MLFSRLRGPSPAVLTCALGALSLSACATTGEAAPNTQTASASSSSKDRTMAPGLDGWANQDPYPSTYRGLPRQNMAIVGATVLTGAGQKIEGGVVVVTDGRIAAVGGADTPVPAGHQVVDARGRFVTPGIIDIHSHLGVYPSPGVQGMSDGNEATNPNTAQVWSEHSIWPQDPGFNTARAGGVTTVQILPGSANLFGGRGVTLRNDAGDEIPQRPLRPEDGLRREPVARLWIAQPVARHRHGQCRRLSRGLHRRARLQGQVGQVARGRPGNAPDPQPAA